jgi:hypothetical protein
LFDYSDAVHAINKRKEKSNFIASEDSADNSVPDENGDDLFKAEEQKPNTFEAVYSDTEESESSDRLFANSTFCFLDSNN